MAKGIKKPKKPSKKDLAEQLRANLRRRKAQARARSGGADGRAKEKGGA